MSRLALKLTTTISIISRSRSIPGNGAKNLLHDLYPYNFCLQVHKSFQVIKWTLSPDYRSHED